MSDPKQTAIDALKVAFPHGHPQFLPTTVAELQLHSDKNHDYAAGGKPTGNFDRVAAILALYPGLKLSDPKVVALTYALKQLDAVLWGISNGIKQKVEGLKERLGDISVYSKIVMCIVDDEAKAAEEAQRPAWIECHHKPVVPSWFNPLGCLGDPQVNCCAECAVVGKCIL